VPLRIRPRCSGPRIVEEFCVATFGRRHERTEANSFSTRRPSRSKNFVRWPFAPANSINSAIPALPSRHIEKKFFEAIITPFDMADSKRKIGDSVDHCTIRAAHF
jgi:hypothetical protein